MIYTNGNGEVITDRGTIPTSKPPKIPRIALIGATGALGTRLWMELTANGWAVDRFSHRPAKGCWPVDLTAKDALVDLERIFRRDPIPDLVINCAACTDVAGIEKTPDIGLVNIVGGEVVACAADLAGIPSIYISSDYAEEDLPSTQYSWQKQAGENAARSFSATVVRVAHLPPEKAACYGWLNGYSKANREWTEQTARRFVKMLKRFQHQSGRIVKLGPVKSVTVAEMVRLRWPNHQALRRVYTDPRKIRELCGFMPPSDTSFWRSP